MSELKPCPFCGRDEITIEPRHLGRFYVVCERCLTQGAGYELQPTAIEKWNARASQWLKGMPTTRDTFLISGYAWAPDDMVPCVYMAYPSEDFSRWVDASKFTRFDNRYVNGYMPLPEPNNNLDAVAKTFQKFASEHGQELASYIGEKE